MAWRTHLYDTMGLIRLPTPQIYGYPLSNNHISLASQLVRVRDKWITLDPVVVVSYYLEINNFSLLKTTKTMIYLLYNIRYKISIIGLMVMIK